MSERAATFVRAAAKLGLATGLAGLFLLLASTVLPELIATTMGLPFEAAFMSLSRITLPATAAVLSSTAMVAAGTLAHRMQLRRSLVVASGLGCTGLLASALALSPVWATIEAWTLVLRIGFAASSLGIAAAAIGGFESMVVPQAAARPLRWTTVVLIACATAAALGLSCITGIAHRLAPLNRELAEVTEGALWTMLVVCLLLALATGALTRVMARRRAPAPESLATKASIELSCPKCGTLQTLGTGYVRCTACRFLMRIEVEEPRCECGYLLFRIERDTCPECGRAIAGLASSGEAG